MKLYLIPSLLSEDSINSVSPKTRSVIASTNFYLVEHLKTARRFIKKVMPNRHIDSLTFFVLDKRTTALDISDIFKQIPDNESVGVISEAGCPCIADPGHLAVKYAHQHQIQVIPLVGASSILLALIASGLNGQSFVFHGYLPIKSPARSQKLKALENNAYRYQQTQIFMETPYRNNQLLKDIIAQCKSQTQLCIASNLTADTEFIKTQSIEDWKKHPLPDLHKQPSIFLLG